MMSCANSGGASPAELWTGIASRLDGSTPPSWERLARRLGPEADRGARSDEVADATATAGSEQAAAAGPGSGNVIPIGSGSRRGRVAMRVAVIVGAAAVVAAVALGVKVDHLNHQVSALQGSTALTRAEQAAIRAPSTKEVLLRAPASAGPTAVGKVTVVLTRSGTGFVEAGGLSSLPTSETYQLWGVIGSRTISLGLLGSKPRVVPFSVAGATPVGAFAITAEHAGGVVQSSHQPVVAGEVTA